MCRDKDGWSLGLTAAFKMLWGTDEHAKRGCNDVAEFFASPPKEEDKQEEPQTPLVQEGEETGKGKGRGKNRSSAYFHAQTRIGRMSLQADALKEELQTVPEALARIAKDL